MYNSFVFDLFAHFVKLDGVISDQEIDFINKTLQIGYSQEKSEKYFNLFLKALETDLAIESIIEEINREISDDYLKKIILILSVYELICSDSIDEQEIEEFSRVCSMLKIKDVDRDLINSLLIDSYDYDYIENINRKINIGPDSEEFDLIYDKCNLEIFIIDKHYFLVNKDSQVSVFIDNKEIHPRKIRELKTVSSIYIDEKKILIDHLDWIFNQNTSKSIYYRIDSDKLFSEYDENKSDIKIDIDRNIIRFYRNSDSDFNLTIGEEKFKNFIYLNISDNLLFNDSYKISCLMLIESYGQECINLSELTSTIKEVVICNNKDIDIRIDISFDESYYFTVHPNKINNNIKIDDRYLIEGETLIVQNSCEFIVGNIQYELNANIGDIVESRIHFSDFQVEDLFYKFSDGNIGVDNISFHVKQQELVALMGASGAGKSTLLQLLLGYLKPQKGKVLINGHDFHKNFNAIKNYIGYVPQDDLLFENLSVYDNLNYTAKIRLPELTKSKRSYLVDSILKEIGLFDKKDLKVGSPIDKVLSGGQRKRLNIGMELVSGPDLFFLDEPTSGLSSKDSEMILKLLSKLRNSGKIIFVIIHQPSSELYKIFDKLLLLDVGGKLAYFGDNLQAIDYFKNVELVKDKFIECPSCKKVDPEIIFNILEKKEVGRDGLPLYEKVSSYGSGLEKIVRKILNKPKSKLLPKRRYDGVYWKRLFLTKKLKSEEVTLDNISELPTPIKKGFIKDQYTTFTLIQRSLKEKLNDRMNLILTFLAPLLLSSSLSFILKGNLKPYQYHMNKEFSKFLFMSVIIFIFLGLMSSVNEIIKDRPILMREKILDIKIYQYMLSKIITFIFFSVLQVLIFALISFTILEIPVNLPTSFSLFKISNYFWYFVLYSFVISFSSFSFGLLVSSLIKSQMLAFNLITLIIIPQIVLGGLFLSYDDMVKLKNKNIPIYANITIARWGYEGLLSGSEIFNPLYQVSSSDNLKNHKLSFLKQNIRWDYNTLVDKPMRELKQSIVDVPDIITSQLYDEFDSKIKDELKLYYTLDRDTDSYVIRKLLNSNDKDLIKGIFKKIRPNSFNSEYNKLYWNTSVEEEFILKNSIEWLSFINEREKGNNINISDWFIDFNIFPAHKKAIGHLVMNTVWFNLLILLIQAFLSNVFIYFRLKKI